jgi:hypothetical protein
MTQRSENGSNYLAFTSMPGTAANSQWTAIMQGRDGVLALHGFNNGLRRRRFLSSSSSTPDSVQHSRMQGDSNTMRGARRNRKLAQGPFVGPVSAFVPYSTPTNGWITMSVYNDGSRGAHPLHIHLIDFFICNR